MFRSPRLDPQPTVGIFRPFKPLHADSRGQRAAGGRAWLAGWRAQDRLIRTLAHRPAGSALCVAFVHQANSTADSQGLHLPLPLSTPSVHRAIQQQALGGLDMNGAGVGRVLGRQRLPRNTWASAIQASRRTQGRAPETHEHARIAPGQTPSPGGPNQTAPLQTSTRVFDRSSYD